jgi:hypothetical protein
MSENSDDGQVRCRSVHGHLRWLQGRCSDTSDDAGFQLASRTVLGKRGGVMWENVGWNDQT